MNTDTPAAPAPERNSALWSIFGFFTSLKLCVVLLTLCAFGVFLGTLAQVHEGLYLAQERWFKSWWIWRQQGDDWYVWTYPGGYLLGVLLLINLTGAHLRRIKFPPGGLWVMIPYYLLVMTALFFITREVYNSYRDTRGGNFTPLILFQFFILVLVVDMVLSAPFMKMRRMMSAGKKLGVDFVHFGIVILLGGQLSTDMWADETHMSFKEGQTRNYSESWTDSEIMLARDNQEDPAKEDVTAIPHSMVVKGNEVISGVEVKHRNLPFTLKVKSWQPNCELVHLPTAGTQEASLRQAFAALETRYANVENLVPEAQRAMENPGRMAVWTQTLKELKIQPAGDLPGTAGEIIKDPARASSLLKALKEAFKDQMMKQFKEGDADMRFAAWRVEKSPDGSLPLPKRQAECDVAKDYRTEPVELVKEMGARNFASAVVELTGTNGSIGTWLISPFLKNQTFVYGGQAWRIALRDSRIYYPFSVTLLQTTHQVYTGTDNPRDFRSKVLLDYPEKQERRETEIFMNAPLRFADITFFQQQMGRDEVEKARGTSVLQMVKNPSWFLPYFGCALVSYGMLRHFLLHLFRFISRRSRS